MCVSCGCGSPNDSHGDQRNITMDDLDQAAQAVGINRDQVVKNINSSSLTNQSGSSYGQTQGSNQLQNQPGSQQNYDQSQSGSTQGSQSSSYSQNDQAMGHAGKYNQPSNQPGQYSEAPGTQTSSAWGQGQDQDNYQPPDRQNPSY